MFPVARAVLLSMREREDFVCVLKTVCGWTSKNWLLPYACCGLHFIDSAACVLSFDHSTPLHRDGGLCVCFLASNIIYALLDTALLVHFYQWNVLAFDIFDTFARYASPFHDITDMDCWAQNGSTQSCFHDFQTYTFNKQENKSCKTIILKPAAFLLQFHSFQHGLWCFFIFKIHLTTWIYNVRKPGWGVGAARDASWKYGWRVTSQR